MVGAVSAADENVADDNLEISDEISVDEVESEDVLEIDEDNNLQMSDIDPDTVDSNEGNLIMEETPSIVADNVTIYQNDDILSFYAKFTDEDGNPLNKQDVKFILDGVEYIIKTKKTGVATFPTSELLPGNHTIISCNPVTNYNLTNSINVIQGAVASNLNITYGDGNKVIVTYYYRNGTEFKPENGGKPYLEFFTVESGMERVFTARTPVNRETAGVEYDISDLAIGEYDARVVLQFDPEGGQLKYYFKINILAPPTIILDNITFIDVNSKLSVDFADELGNPLNNAVVSFKIGNDTVNVTTNENGTAYLDLGFLPLGDYNITIINPITGESISRNISLITDETIIAEDIALSYNDELKFAANFVDKYGKSLSKTNVTVIIGNESMIVTTDENGLATFIIPELLDVGVYNVTMINPLGGEIIKTLTINKADASLSSSDVSMVYNVPKKLTIVLTDNKGSFLANKNVKILLNGKTYNKVTNNKGEVVLSVNLPAKKYTATITFEDKNYNNTKATAKIIVAKAKPKMTAKKATFKAKKKTKKYSIILKDNKNKVMKKVKVTLKVKGKTYKATTNAKGKAIFKIKKLTKKGKYTAKVTFKGNSNFKALSKSVKIIVK